MDRPTNPSNMSSPPYPQTGFGAAFSIVTTLLVWLDGMCVCDAHTDTEGQMANVHPKTPHDSTRPISHPTLPKQKPRTRRSQVRRHAHHQRALQHRGAERQDGAHRGGRLLAVDLGRHAATGKGVGLEFV